MEIDCGSGGWRRQGRATGKIGTTLIEQKFFKSPKKQAPDKEGLV